MFKMKLDITNQLFHP